MAEEEVIILEDDYVEEESSSQTKQESKAPAQESEQVVEATVQDSTKVQQINLFSKRNIIIISVIFFFIILTFIILIFSGDSKQEEYFSPEEVAQDLKSKEARETFEPSKLDNLLKKANLLYNRGNRQDALKIYEDIAHFNEGLSNYNIGVARMNEEEYAEALESFKLAIRNSENRTISAINAAVCALELKNSEMAEYYLDLAYAYLPEESNSPLFSYYTGLIYYYKQMYLEALTAFSRPTSEHYKQRQNYLSSKILTYFDLDHSALNTIMSNKDNNSDALTLGLLNARIGEFGIAKSHLMAALRSNPNNSKALMALSLVELKLGDLRSASGNIQHLKNRFPDQLENIYPIKTVLKKSLFDVNQAQKDFAQNNFFDKEKRYSMLFYYAPYKIYDAQQNVDYIRKGGLNITQNQSSNALDFLQTGASLSQVNGGISQAIAYAIEYQIFLANQILEKLVEVYPQHAILHYNLGLTYAQMNNYSLANRHFTTSYRLDPKNYLGGIFAIMSAELIGKDVKLLTKDVKESVANEQRDGEDSIHTALLYLVENSQLALIRWLESEKSKNGLNLALDIITSALTHNNNMYRQKSEELKSLLPKDLMANITLFNSKYGSRDIKDYARLIQMEFRKFDIDMNAFYFGPLLAKEQYIKLLQIGGIQKKERNIELERLEKTTNENPIGITNSLAFISIYTNHFKEAYALYNQLIDEYKIQDSATLFLASVAAIGAGENPNAIALLELSKLKDPTNNESRFALGLLYQEVKNFDGATIQYNLVEDSNFNSKYFSFNITR